MHGVIQKNEKLRGGCNAATESIWEGSPVV